MDSSTEWALAGSVAAAGLSALGIVLAPRGVASYVGTAARALLAVAVALLALALALAP